MKPPIEGIWSIQLASLQRGKLPIRNIDNIAQLLHSTLDIVNDKTAERFNTLRLQRKPKVILEDNIHLVTPEELDSSIKEEKKQTMHPLLLKVLGYFPSIEEPPKGRTVGNDVFINVDQWLKPVQNADRELTQEEILQRLLVKTFDLFYHEGGHVQCETRVLTPNEAEEEGIGFILPAMSIDFSQKIISSPDHPASRIARTYQRRIADAIKNNDYHIKIQGGSMYFIVDGKCLCWGGNYLDEAIPSYEGYIMDYYLDGGSPEGYEFDADILDTPPASTEKDGHNWFLWWNHMFELPRQMKRKFGMALLLDSFYSGNIYKLARQMSPSQEETDRQQYLTNLINGKFQFSLDYLDAL